VPAPVDLACVVHCHSTYSDGTGTVAQIAAAARRAGADAVLLTDHDTLAARRRGEEGWYGTSLVCVGLEISPPGRNHYLAFGLDEEIDHAGLSATAVVDAVAAAGGFGFAAHPFSRGSTRFRFARGMPYEALDHPGLAGVELWSWVNDAAEGMQSVRDLARFVAAPERVVEHPPPMNLAAWDRLCAVRPVVAIGGVDAHQFGLRVRGRVPLRLMGYHRSFRHLRTHVMLDRPVAGDGARDRDAVYAALRAGRCYLAVDSIASARGFRFAARGPRGGVRAAMGAEVAAGGDVRLEAHVPQPATLRLIRDGRLVEQCHGLQLSRPAEERGVYRVEARLPAYGAERTWILSNPIYVR
jgi:hypothetical protein